MGDFESLDQFQIRTIGHIDQTDVVVLPIKATGARLIGPLEPVGPDHLRQSKGVFDIVAVSDSALRLIADLNEARSQSPCRRTEVEFSDMEWPFLFSKCDTHHYLFRYAFISEKSNVTE
jgi:hypothetical protein